MIKVSVEQIRERLKQIDRVRLEYEDKSATPTGLVRHEVWRHEYLAHPYLVGAPDDRVAQRFRDVFMNVTELNQEGKLSPVPMSETDEYIKAFTHLLEEYGVRVGSGPPDSLIEEARRPIVKYFDQGTPVGVTMFDGYKAASTPILVKYGKRHFLEPMFRTGDLRLANASSYNSSSLLTSIRDDETSRTFFIPTYRERLAGETGININGHRMEFEDDDIVLPLVFDDYYLLSLCGRIHHRMASDFEADAAIVIRDPALFTQRLISSALTRLPGWEPMHGPVTYYDPYRDYTKFNVPEMAKHFGYGYQKEVRVVLRPRLKPTSPLEPLYLSIGSMKDYADLVHI